MHADMASAVQSATPGQKIELFDLDFRPVDPATTVLRFTPNADPESAPSIKWRSNNYLPLPIFVDGIEVSSRGALPRPTLKLSNIFGTANAILLELGGDIGGGILTRWVTFTKFLDQGDTPNPNAYFPTDIYVLDRIVSRDMFMMEIECRSYLDFDRAKLPGRRMFNNFCGHTYRVWTGSTFDYTHATCPFAGSQYFDKNGTSTVASGDACGKRLTDCRKRFNKDPLPTRAFPGVGRIR